MEINEVIGIDVSKLTLDCCVHKSQEFKVFNNDAEGIKKLMDWSLKKSKMDKRNILFVLEHTGLYSAQLVRLLDGRDCLMNIVSGLEVKRSLGITRGRMIAPMPNGWHFMVIARERNSVPTKFPVPPWQG